MPLNPPSGFRQRQPEDDVVVMTIVDSGTEIKRWKSYDFNSNFLIPTDAFHFVCANEEINGATRDALIPGAEVKLTVNGAVQGSARIDKVSYTTSRQAGSELHIEGRDKLASLIDSGIDPVVKFNPQMTLLEFLAEVFGPFGFAADSFIISNEGNRGVMSKNLTGTKTSKGKKTAGKALQSYVLHQLRPYSNEHAFEFAARVCQRFGLWLALSADGTNIIAKQPDYNQDAIYEFRRRYSDQTNNFNGQVALDLSEQPSIIVADGFSGGVEFGRSTLRCISENPGLDVDNSRVLKTYKNSGAKIITIPFSGPKIKAPHARPLFLHDDEAKTPEQLESFVKREMSLRLRKMLQVNISVYGHEQDDVIFTTDTMANFIDDISGIRTPLWMLSRTFRKSRETGSTTDIELIRPFSLTF
jgi:prophage tail gpP-like protein